MNKLIDSFVVLLTGSSLYLGFWNWISSFGVVSQIATFLLTLITIVFVLFRALNEIKKYRKK